MGIFLSYHAHTVSYRGNLLPPAQRLGNCVAARRQELGLTINDLAARAGVSRITVRHTEQCRPGYAPSGTVMLKLATALGLTVQDLFWSEPAARDQEPAGAAV